MLQAQLDILPPDRKDMIVREPAMPSEINY